MRTVIAIVFWIIYVAWINIYISSLGFLDMFYSLLIYMISSFLMLTFCGLSVLKGFKSDLHKAIIAICIFSVAANFVLMIAYYLIGMDNYKINFCTFNGIELVTACCILISGKKHDLFKYEQNTVH